jgi:translation initiation factor 1
MAFERLIGQKNVKDTLSELYLSGRVGHAYLFNGPSGIGKKSFAKEFAGLVMCPSATDGKRCGVCECCVLMDNSTNPDYNYVTDDEPEVETLPKQQQKLRVQMEKNHRGGKTVTIVRGFVGTDDDLKALAKLLKTRCGVGGSAKEGEIIIQGDFKPKVVELLLKEGYTQTK